MHFRFFSVLFCALGKQIAAEFQWSFYESKTDDCYLSCDFHMTQVTNIAQIMRFHSIQYNSNPHWRDIHLLLPSFSPLYRSVLYSLFPSSLCLLSHFLMYLLLPSFLSSIPSREAFLVYPMGRLWPASQTEGLRERWTPPPAQRVRSEHGRQTHFDAF